MGAEPPFHYEIEGSDLLWLVFRTEQISEGSRGGRVLYSLIPDLPSPEQNILDVITMFEDDPRLSVGPRTHAVAVSKTGVTAFVKLLDLSRDGVLTGEVDATIEIWRPQDGRGQSHTTVTAHVVTEATDA